MKALGQSLTELAAQLKALAGHSTADLIGFAPGDAFSEEELGGLGQTFGPVRTVVVLAQRIVDPIQMVRCQDRGGYRESKVATLYAGAMLRDASWRVVELLRAADHAAAIPRYLRYGDDDPRHHISFKKAGVLAGLGTLGRNQLLIHPEWGPWLVLGAVITDAPLPCGVPLTASPCTDCRLCLEACPRGALSEEGIDREKCRAGVGEEEIPGWSALRVSPLGQINCEECLRACPVGVAPPRLRPMEGAP